jgi:hypothetical protein
MDRAADAGAARVVPPRRVRWPALVIIAATFGVAPPAFAAGEPTGYARFCTIMTPSFAPGAHYRDAMAAHEAPTRALLAGDDVIANDVRAKLGLATAPTVVVRNAQALYGKPTDPERVLLSDLDAASPHWWQATLGPSHSLDMLEPANPAFVRAVVGYARTMAAYVLFNDLEGGDEPFPRQGCAALFHGWFGLMPEVEARLQRAIASPPRQDEALNTGVARAWAERAAARTNHDTASDILMNDTIRRVGAHPAVVSVYHDAGLPGDGVGPLDVVRIGGAKHAYMMVGSSPIIDAGRPVCIAGDNRCAVYNVWP